jgi:hypothetical protein
LIRARNPSPVPLRLVKAPAAGHALPRGEGYDFDFTPGVKPKMWDTLSPKGEGCRHEFEAIDVAFELVPES